MRKQCLTANPPSCLNNIRFSGQYLFIWVCYMKQLHISKGYASQNISNIDINVQLTK